MQKKLAASILKSSPKRVKYNTERLDEIKEAITRADIAALIKDGAIIRIPKKGVSRVRARKRHIQKTKGRRRGKGKRKGTKNARNPRKDAWMNKIRSQRKCLCLLKEKKLISSKIYSEMYQKASGGFFRNMRHIKLYLNEHKLFTEKNKEIKPNNINNKGR